MAYQEVLGAFNEMRLVPYGAGDWPTPFRYQWEERFKSAASSLAGAREYLAKATK
jgi:hypothetical protein